MTQSDKTPQSRHGTFSAWAAPDATTVSVDYVEDGPEHAMLAAELALKRKTGHARCSPACSGWQMHTHDAAKPKPRAAVPVAFPA